MVLNARSILLLVAVIVFLLAAAGVPSRIAWIPLGYAAVAAALIFW